MSTPNREVTDAAVGSTRRANEFNGAVTQRESFRRCPRFGPRLSQRSTSG